jgi:hypothetical protein
MGGRRSFHSELAQDLRGVGEAEFGYFRGGEAIGARVATRVPRRDGSLSPDPFADRGDDPGHPLFSLDRTNHGNRSGNYRLVLSDFKG